MTRYNSETWLTIQEVAKLFKVSPRTVRRWIADGLPVTRIGRTVRIRRDSLDGYFASRTRCK